MKNVLVRLATLQEGIVIVSDIFDAQGRLLAKSPVTLDENLKKLLQSQGVREVFVEENEGAAWGEDDQSIQIRMEDLKISLSLMGSGKKDTALKSVILKTIEEFYRRN